MRQSLRNWLFVFLFSASSVGSGIDADKNRMRLEVAHASLLGSSYKLKSISFVLDGKTIVEKAVVEGGKESEPSGLLYEGNVETGDHSLKMEFVYEGRSSVFFYVNSYRFLMKARVRFHASPEYVFNVRTTLKQHNDITIPWEKRPYIEMDAVPKAAILPDEDEAPSVVAVPVDAGTPVLAAEEAQTDCNGDQGCPDGSHCVEGTCKSSPVVIQAKGKVKPERANAHCRTEPILFEFNRAEITSEGESQLRAFAACLMTEDKLPFRIEGHCDRRGSDKVNDALGMKRARAVAKFIAEQGIKSVRFHLSSLGKRKPRCMDDSEACHAENRRVEVITLADKLRSAYP